MISSAMNLATSEAAWPILARVAWVRIYHAIVATPLNAADVMVGGIAFIVGKVAFAAAFFAGVLLVTGIATSSTVALGMIAVSVLTAFAFGAPMAAFSVTQKSDQGFAFLFRLIITPLSFFSGTYFPIENLPFAAQVLSGAPRSLTAWPSAAHWRWAPRHLRRVPHRRTAAVGDWRLHRCDLLLRKEDAEVIASLAPRAFSVFERNCFVYRRQWLIIVTGFFEPLFFLLGIGYGVGGVIGTIPYWWCRGSVCGLRCSCTSCERCNERRHFRLYLQHLLQVEVRQGL